MKAVVSFADATGNYPAKMQRLSQSLSSVKFDGQFFGFDNTESLGCKTHKQIPYQFKPYAIKKAYEQGANVILWCDSPVYAKSNIQPVFDHIEKHGYLFFDNIGFSLGDFTNDKTLDFFKITREQSWKIPMIMACVMGFDFRDNKMKPIFDEYMNLSDTLYRGDWDNQFKTESSDMRVRGHRHDQSVMSCLCYKYGLTITHAQNTFFAYESHRLVMPIADTVCLYSG